MASTASHTTPSIVTGEAKRAPMFPPSFGSCNPLPFILILGLLLVNPDLEMFGRRNGIPTTLAILFLCAAAQAKTMVAASIKRNPQIWVCPRTWPILVGVIQYNNTTRIGC
uniref:Uncharacterized protein isoform X2 n=1 Tax=Nicotiana tabacum TaxID=4097 RepID=A0A1S3YVR6_TOBAC|nr:PREDICTED: uncharacterized protein LOC107780217 isoform X2 [Nicotiana tabacum]